MIRPARPRDKPILSQLQGHLAEPSPELLDYVLGAATSGPLDISGDILVSTHGETPVGYLLAVHGGETHVAELVVAPDYRRAGRAAALLGALFDRLPAGRQVTVAVAPGNDAARALYESAGFEVVAEKPDFFEEGSALLLARTVGTEQQ